METQPFRKIDDFTRIQRVFQQITISNHNIVAFTDNSLYSAVGIGNSQFKDTLRFAVIKITLVQLFAIFIPPVSDKHGKIVMLAQKRRYIVRKIINAFLVPMGIVSKQPFQRSVSVIGNLRHKNVVSYFLPVEIRFKIP